MLLSLKPLHSGFQDIFHLFEGLQPKEWGTPLVSCPVNRIFVGG